MRIYQDFNQIWQSNCQVNQKSVFNTVIADTSLDFIIRDAENGNPKSQYDLGVCYLEGYKGCEKSGKQAIQWFLKAAKQGYYKAQLGLALLYYDGQYVKRSIEEAIKWFKLAKAQNPNDQFLKRVDIDKL